MGVPPHIDSYRFGSVTVDGEVYTVDVIVRPEGVLADWWRKEGHGLHPEDLAGALDPSLLRRSGRFGYEGRKPHVLVIGCGASGVLRIPDETRRWITDRGIELVALRTADACRRYNELSGTSHVVAGLHLTC